MKTILCYGDSNTWGYNPLTCTRHPYHHRWTSILQKELGEEYLVIPEGLNGRTSVLDDPVELHRNGMRYLPACLESHKPLDLVVILLGTNDLKVRFPLPASDIAKGVGVLVDLVNKSETGPEDSAPRILVLIPPEVRKLTDFGDMFAGAREKSLLFPEVFRAMAEDKSVSLLDIGKTVRFSDADGIHFETDQLEKLGKLMAEKVRKLV